jgi:hypothetical protein
MDSDGNMAYQIDANKLNGVIGAHISLKNGTDWHRYSIHI